MANSSSAGIKHIKKTLPIKKIQSQDLTVDDGYNIREAVPIPVNATGAIPIQDSPT
jgi:hypothetical protein